IAFLTIQPRIVTGLASIDYWDFQTRIENRGILPARALTDSNRGIEPWAELVEAIASEKAKSGGGVEPLLRLWESHGRLPEIIAALVLRNLVAAMLLHRETVNARKFLEAGTKLYPTFAELYYLAGQLAVRENRYGEALPLLERAKSCGATFV